MNRETFDGRLATYFDLTNNKVSNSTFQLAYFMSSEIMLCMRACVRACMRASVRACMRACVRTLHH